MSVWPPSTSIRFWPDGSAAFCGESVPPTPWWNWRCSVSKASRKKKNSAAHLEVLRDPGQQLARARWQDLLAHVCYLLAGCLSFTQPGSHSGISVGHADELIHADVLEIVRERANGIGQFRWGCRIQARKVDIRRLQVSPGGRWPPPLPSQRNDGATSFAQNRSAARRLRNQGNGLDGNLLRRG